MGKHKNTHRYIFMNNGGFNIFQSAAAVAAAAEEEAGEAAASLSGRRRKSTASSTATAAAYQYQMTPSNDVGGAAGGEGGGGGGHGGDRGFSPHWNAREEMRLLDAVEQFGYGNWKDIAGHVETKSAEQAKEEYIKHYIHGLVGKHTWKEELRGYAVDHTQREGAVDRGPLSPTLTGKLPPIAVSGQEALLLGYMPHRDDFEDFDKSTERLVAQIADKSVEDEGVDVALKLAQVDIYERRLREQVRRKRVARDYQLVSRFYRENPIVQIGLGGKLSGGKLSPTKISNQVKAVKKGDGPRQELIDALKPMTQFYTAQEFAQCVTNLCVEKELKVRVKELLRYRENGLRSTDELVPFECERFKRELKVKRLAKMKMIYGGAIPTPPSRFLPAHGDYSLKAILDPEHEEKAAAAAGAAGGGGPFGGPGKRARKTKKSKWSKKKMKTGRRLLLQQGCILTLASPARRDSTDSTN